MQLPPTDELVLVSGLAPIRAKKARYYADKRLAARVLPPPERKPGTGAAPVPGDDWSALKPIAAPALASVPAAAPAPAGTTAAAWAAKPAETEDPANAGIRREPELPEHEAIAPETPQTRPAREFDDLDDEPNAEEGIKSRLLQARASRSLARQVALDPGDGMAL